MAAQQAKQRTLELEESATRGNDYVQTLHQQGNAYEQAATQRIRELEDENRNIAEKARQQESALRARLAAIENKELDRAFADMKRFNQPPASAQTS